MKKGYGGLSLSRKSGEEEVGGVQAFHGRALGWVCGKF